MLKKKYEEFLEIMESILKRQGYQKSRKKGEYHKSISGKIMKIRIVLSSVMRSGTLGEIRAFVALEYPELEKMVSTLKEERYKKGNNLFSQDIGLLCGERLYYALHFSCDSNMEYVGAAMGAKLVDYVFPVMSDYEDDKNIMHKFECDNVIWRNNYFSGDHADFDYYVRWISFCLLYGYIREAFLILDNIPKFYHLDKDIEKMKERLKVLCLGREQADSVYLLVNNRIKINPEIAEIKKGLHILDGLKSYFLILEESKKGNYLQIAGGSGEYTVEVRLYSNQEYDHYRAETKNKNIEVKRVLYGGSCLSLQTSQVLSIDQVYEIICKYLTDQELHGNYDWVKVNL